MLERAERVTGIPPDLQQLNKRTVHRAMEIMGMRTAIRYGSEILSLGLHQRSSKEYLGGMAQGKLTDSLAAGTASSGTTVRAPATSEPGAGAGRTARTGR